MSSMKPILRLASLCCLLLVTAGCSVIGIGAQRFGNVTTITWLVRTDPHINPWEYQVVKDFEAAYPSIHVQLVISPNGAHYDQKLTTMQVGWEAADIFTTWGNNSWADEVSHGFAADLTPYIKASNFSLDGMNPRLIDQYTVNGKIYAIPFGSGGSFVFYNIDLFNKAHVPLPPTDWNDKSWNQQTILKDGLALTKAGQSLNDRQYGLSDDLWPENANAWLFGGDMFSQSAYENGVVDHITATASAVQQGEQWKHDLIYKYKTAPTPADATLLDGFLSNKLAMTMNGIWGFLSYKPATFHWGAAPLPYFQTDKDVVFTDAWMMAKTSKHPQEAWTFLKWLSDPHYGARTYLDSAGSVPPWSQLLPIWAARMQKLMPDKSIQQLEQLAQGSLDHGQESINHLAINYGQYDSVISNVTQSLYNNAGVTPAETTTTLQQQLDATIQKVGPVQPLS